MGKQPGRHTDWLCNGRGLSAAAGTADRGRAEHWQADTAAAVKGVTLCHREAGNPLRRRSAKLYICLRSQSSLAAKVMEMKLHRLRDVRSDYGLLKQHG